MARKFPIGKEKEAALFLSNQLEGLANLACGNVLVTTLAHALNTRMAETILRNEAPELWAKYNTIKDELMKDADSVTTEMGCFANGN